VPTREQIQSAVDDSADTEVAAAAEVAFSGLGNAALVSRLLADSKVASLFASAPLDVFGDAVAGQTSGDGDLVFDDDDAAADYLNAIEGDGAGVTGTYLGQIAHRWWETEGFAPRAPGTPVWLDRTVGTICEDVGASGQPRHAALRPDGAALLPNGSVLDAELKPARIQQTAVPQLAEREASFAAAGVGVAHQHGAWSEGAIGPIPLAFNMTMLYEPGVEPGVVAYRWTKQQPAEERQPEVVPTSERVLNAVKDRVNAFREWWVDTVRQHPGLVTAFGVACIVLGLVGLVVLLARVLPLLIPLLPLLGLPFVL
jgi:hypothetical protein